MTSFYTWLVTGEESHGRVLLHAGNFVKRAGGRVLHNVRNLSDDPMRMILTFTSAGIEKFFEESLDRACDLTQDCPANLPDDPTTNPGRYARAGPGRRQAAAPETCPRRAAVIQRRPVPVCASSVANATPARTPMQAFLRGDASFRRRKASVRDRRTRCRRAAPFVGRGTEPRAHLLWPLRSGRGVDELAGDPVRDIVGIGSGKPEDDVLKAGVDGVCDPVSGCVDPLV